MCGSPSYVPSNNIIPERKHKTINVFKERTERTLRFLDIKRLLNDLFFLYFVHKFWVDNFDRVVNVMDGFS